MKSCLIFHKAASSVLTVTSDRDPKDEKPIKKRESAKSSPNSVELITKMAYCTVSH